jgi:hypothetical protein
VATPALLKALAAYLVAQVVVGSAVFAWPELVHRLDEVAAADRRSRRNS